MWLGERNKARDDAEALLKLLESFEADPDRVNLTGRAGVILQRIGDRQAAIDVYGKAMADADAQGLEASRIPLLLDLGRLHMEFNENERAQERFGQAIGLIEKLGERTLEPRARLNMGFSLASQGHLPEAAVWWEQVHAIYRKYGNAPPLEEVPNMVRLATAFQYSGQTPRAKELVEQLRGMKVPISDPGIRLNLALIEVSQLEQKGQREAALARLDTFDVDSMLYLQQVQLLMRRIALLRPLGRFEQAFELSQKLMKLQIDYLNSQNHERMATLEARLQDRDQRLQMQRMQAEAEEQTLALRRSSRRWWQAIGGGSLLMLGAVAILLWQRRMNQRLDRVGRCDALTGLSNRRDMSETLRLQAAVSGATAAILLIDIDLFKRINDEFGHEAGDAVLIAFARRLEAVVGSAGRVARWGGEEFLVLLPGADEQAARTLSERIRQGQAERVVVGERQLLATVSIGYCNLPVAGTQGAEAWNQSLQLADASLYVAKEAGRDAWAGVWITDIIQDWPSERLASEFDMAHASGVLTLASSRPFADASASHG